MICCKTYDVIQCTINTFDVRNSVDYVNNSLFYMYIYFLTIVVFFYPLGISKFCCCEKIRKQHMDDCVKVNQPCCA